MLSCYSSGCISDEVDTVAERVHLIYWVLKEEIAIRRIASLQTLMDRIGHNDRLCDLHHNSSVAVTGIILLISEHVSNRIVSDVKQSPCWAMYGRRDNQYCCNVMSIPLVATWPEQKFSTPRHVKTKLRNRLFDVTLKALINVSMNGPESL